MKSLRLFDIFFACAQKSFESPWCSSICKNVCSSRISRCVAIALTQFDLAILWRLIAFIRSWSELCGLVIVFFSACSQNRRWSFRILTAFVICGIEDGPIFFLPIWVCETSSRHCWKLHSTKSAILVLSTSAAWRARMWLRVCFSHSSKATLYDRVKFLYAGLSVSVGIFSIRHTSLSGLLLFWENRRPWRVIRIGLWSEPILSSTISIFCKNGAKGFEIIT